MVRVATLEWELLPVGLVVAMTALQLVKGLVLAVLERQLVCLVAELCV